MPAVARQRYDEDFTRSAQNRAKPTTDILEKMWTVEKTTKRLNRVLITKAVALDILTLNEGNRPVKNETIRGYSQLMKDDKWRYTHESVIAIDWNRHLRDSQQRLWAIVDSGKSQYFDISLGRDPDDFQVINQGRNRTGGDTLALVGYVDPNKAAAAATFIISYQEFGKVVSGTGRRLFHFDHLVEWARDEKNKKRLEDCVKTADELYKQGGWLSHMFYTSMLFILGTYRKTDAEEFMTRLAIGEMISKEEYSPIFYLRKILVDWKEKYGNIKRTQASELKFRWIVTAWNHYLDKGRDGKPLKIEKLVIDKHSEELPKIRRS